MIEPLPIKDSNEMNDIMSMLNNDFFDSLDFEEQLYVMQCMNRFAGEIKGVIMHKAMRGISYDR